MGEPKVKDLLKIPDEYATACHIALGYLSVPFPKKLTRLPLSEVVFKDRFNETMYE